MNLESLFNSTVTTASKFPEKLADAAGVVSVVTRDELARFGGVTLVEILGRVAGLAVSSSYSLDNSLIAVRGDEIRVDGGHVLILINGRPVRETLQGGVNTDILKSFPVGILERIEVIKGPGSVLYGSDAFSGVINLITKKAKGTQFSMNPSHGTEGAAAGGEEALFSKGELQIVEGAQYHQYAQWDVNYLANGPANLEHDQQATLRNDGAGAYLGVNFKGLSFMSAYTEAESPTFVRGIVGDARLKKAFGDLGYTLNPTKIWQMSFNFTYTRSLANAPIYPSIGRDSYDAILEWTNFVTFSDRDKLTFGTLFDHVAGTEKLLNTSPVFVDSSGSRNSGALYAQLEHKLTDDLKLIGGVQVNKIGAIAVNAVPRGGVLWNPTVHWTVKALYGEAFHAPSLDELMINHPGLKGDPNLVPEKVGTFDLQLSYRNNRLQASVDYFHSRMTDLIVHLGSVIPALYYNYAKPVSFEGAEAEGKYYLERNWYLIGSVLYQTNNSGTGLANLSPVPSLIAKAGLSYQAARGATVSVFDAYQGYTPGYAASGNSAPSAFHAVSAHVRYDFSKLLQDKGLLKDDAHGFALFAHADDLTNHPVWLPALGSNQAGTIPVIKGRTVLFGFEVWQKPRQ